MAESTYQQGDKFVRVVALFDLLFRTREGRTTQELADELGVDVRSVQRYLRQMEAAGLDIERDESGRRRIGAASRLPPMQFSKAEGAAVLVALRLLQQMRPGRDPARVGAVARLAAAMQLRTVTSYLGSMLEEGETPGDSAARGAVENVVVQCFVDRLPCEIEYEAGDGRVSRRVVRTYFLEPRPESRTVYLHALDESTSSMRWFRMDRIRSAREVRIAGTYTVPADYDITEVTRSSWGVWQPGAELDEVVLRFDPSVAARVRQSVWHRSESFSELGDGRLEMRVRVASEIEMRPWVLGWGALVEVVAPASLRDHVAGSMRAGARLYGDG